MSSRVALGVGVLVACGLVLLAVSQRVLDQSPAAATRALEVRTADAARARGAPGREPARVEAEPEIEEGQRSESARDKSHKTYSVRLDELKSYCWGDRANPSRAYDSEPVNMFALRIPTRAHTSTRFDFCIEQVRLGGTPLVWGRDGRVEGSLGLSGEWITFSDEVTIWEQPGAGQGFEGSVEPGAPLCVRGTAPEVFEGQYGDYWGAAIGLRFRRSGAASGRSGAVTPRFSTIELQLVGDEIPQLLSVALDRNAFRADNESWCAFVRERSDGAVGSSNPLGRSAEDR
jgi:hypothetical protein